MVGFAILHQNDKAFRLKNERANEQIEKKSIHKFRDQRLAERWFGFAVYACGSQELTKYFHGKIRLSRRLPSCQANGVAHKISEPFFSLPSKQCCSFATVALSHTIAYSLDLRVKCKSIRNDIEISSPSHFSTILFHKMVNFIRIWLVGIERSIIHMYGIG